MAQHHFYHWLHIRSLYESQFTQYLAADRLVPLDIHSHTVTSSQQLAPDSYRVHLTTTTTTVMPHATATTSTSTSYSQLTSDVLCLPPSPPLLASAGFVPPAPFSYDYSYPSHPFSYPPAAVLEALPAAMRDEDSWAGYEPAPKDEEALEEVDTEEDEAAQPSVSSSRSSLSKARGSAERWRAEMKADNAEDEDEEEVDDDTADSDDEWSEDGADRDVTEADLRSSYAPSYAASYACSDAEEEEEEVKVEAAVEAAVERRRRQLAMLGLSF